MLLLAAVWLALAPAPATAERVGAIDWVKLWAFERPPGGSEWGDLFRHDSVFQNQGIRTDRGAATHVRFIDGTELRIGSASEIVVDEFVFDASTTAGKFTSEITKGILRMVSGRLAKSGFRITTPVAYIGIRGTDFIVQVAADGTTTAYVLAGAITITPRAGGGETVLDAGETARVAPGATSVETGVQPPAADESLDDEAPNRPGIGDVGGGDNDSGGGNY
jgi:ferric-dicitrate binding protein FerR (iron transport regulator)